MTEDRYRATRDAGTAVRSLPLQRTASAEAR